VSLSLSYNNFDNLTKLLLDLYLAKIFKYISTKSFHIKLKNVSEKINKINNEIFMIKL